MTLTTPQSPQQSPQRNPRHNPLHNQPIRQSLIGDYLTCPKMCEFRWILESRHAPNFFASVLGTAGHTTIQYLHDSKLLSKQSPVSQSRIKAHFIQSAHDALKEQSIPPRLSANFQSHDEQINFTADEYAAYIYEYSKDPRNRKFTTTQCEQKFILKVPKTIDITTLDYDLSDISTQPYDPSSMYLFVGTIDQFGYYVDTGTFSLRDIKFRDLAFIPTYLEFFLNTQLTIYSLGLRYGLPVCAACSPHYYNITEGESDDNAIFDFINEQPNEQQEEPINNFTMPCSECMSKVNTTRWPMKFPEVQEAIWMKGYKRYKKDQYRKWIKSKTKKSINPKTGRLVAADVINPKWENGYKKGEVKAEARLRRNLSLIQTLNLLADIHKICTLVQNGVFFRRPGVQCTTTCMYRDACKNFVDLEV